LTVIAAIDPQCQALIDSNAQTLALIQTIQVNYTIARLNTPQMPFHETWWSRQGRRERIRRVGGKLEPTADGRPRDIHDLLIDGDTYKWLKNWDPENPQHITPTKQGTVRASTGPQTNVNAFVAAPSHELFLEVDSVPRRTLSELAKVSPNVTCKGKVELDGRQLWLISLETPEENTTTTYKCYFDVYLDPNAGYMIRKVVVNAPNVVLANGKTTKLGHAHEVLEFQDFGDGIFVATKIRNGTPQKWLSETVVKSIEVNESIPPETFELDWPKYVQVVHHPAVNGKFRVEIWGDDKPLKEIKKVADVRTFEAELRKDPAIAAELGPEPGTRPPVPMSLMLKLSIVLGVLLIIMTALIIVRRIREQPA
jgi:hypothetical protein